MESNIHESKKASLEIDIVKIFMSCLKNWWIIAIVTVVCGAIAYCYTDLFVSPTYQSNIMINVNNSELDKDREYTSSSDIAASIQLVNWCETILKTRNTLGMIMDVTENDYTYSQLSSMLKTKSVNNTSVFSIIVTAPTPEEAKDIATAIGMIFPDTIKSLRKNVDASVVEDAALPQTPSSPNTAFNTTVGMVLGFVFIVMIIAVLQTLDRKIHSEEDIKSITDIPVLVLIPDFKEVGDEKVYGKKAYQKPVLTENTRKDK